MHVALVCDGLVVQSLGPTLACESDLLVHIKKVQVEGWLTSSVSRRTKVEG